MLIGKVQLPQHSLSPFFVQWLARLSAPSLSQRFDSAKQALASLQAKKSSYESAGHLKPEGTKIGLKRERDRIQITTDAPKSLPSKLLIRGTIALIFGGLLFSSIPHLSFFVLWLIPVLNFAIRHLFVRLFVILSSAKRLVIFEVDRQRGIRIGRRKKHARAVSWWEYTTPYENIDLLAYTLGYQFKPYTQGDKNIRQSLDSTPPGLSVHAGDRTYTIGHSQLSAAEFWWLAQELSDFLDLELQTIYPTPIVTITSTSTCGC